MTHEHERRDGRPVTDPDLCHWCNRAELARHPLAGNALHPVGLAGPFPANGNQPDGCPVHQPLTAP